MAQHAKLADEMAKVTKAIVQLTEQINVKMDKQIKQKREQISVSKKKLEKESNTELRICQHVPEVTARVRNFQG